MITVMEAVTRIIKETPLLEEGLTRGLLNSSAVARDIKDRVEERTRKAVTNGAIIMALQRLSLVLAPPTPSEKVFDTPPDILIRSGLFEYTVSNSPTLLGSQQKLLALAASHNDQYFLTITSGVFETMIFASNALLMEIQQILRSEKKVSEILGLASITIRLTENIVTSPGSYSSILKVLAWEGINIIDLVSTYLELTIILGEAQAARAFTVLKSAFA